MARSSYRVVGLDKLAKRLDKLGNAIPDEAQVAVDDVAEDAVSKMRRPFHAAIEGGPADFTKIRPGSRKSSIVPSKRQRGATKGVAESLIRVQDKQSSFLRFHLDDRRGRKDDDRFPGDVGVAEKKNFIPNAKNLKRWQDISLTPQGGLPRGALRLLNRRAKTTKQRDEDATERSRKRLAAQNGLSLDDPALDALVASVRRRRRKRVPGSKSDIFYGRPKGRGPKSLGFWQRPRHPDGDLVPLVHAEPKSSFRHSDRLQMAWNKGVNDASSEAPERFESAIEEAVRKATKL